MDIIERAARELALQTDGTDKQWKEFVPDVRCVLTAVKETTEKMVALGSNYTSCEYEGATDCWKAMIDEALYIPQ